MEEQKNIIDLHLLTGKVWKQRKLYYWVLPVCFVLSCLFILCFPREYTSQITLAPEAKSADMGGLGSLASSFGFDLGGMVKEDAIYPTIYPDVIGSTDFILDLWKVKVSTADHSFEGTYYDYLQTQTKSPFWRRWGYAIKDAVTSLISNEEQGEHELNPYMLTRRENGYVDYTRKHIVCSIDKKTDLIEIKVNAQDKLVCAQMCDSTREHMQQVMTNYRTEKTRKDMLYYQMLIDSARLEYEQAAKKYIDYADGHSYSLLERNRIEANKLQEEMQMRYNIYSTLEKQYIAAQSKMLENIPVFTTISSARVPVKPSKPKRMFFVLGMMIVATVATTMYILRDEIFR